MDTVLPIAHATAIAAGISTASITIMERMGHIPRLADWLTIAGQITANSA